MEVSIVIAVHAIKDKTIVSFVNDTLKVLIFASLSFVIAVRAVHALKDLTTVSFVNVMLLLSVCHFKYVCMSIQITQPSYI